MFKVENELVPDTVCKLFEKPEHEHQTQSSARGDYQVPRTRLQFGKRCFSYRGPSIWHKIPEMLRAIPDLPSFTNYLNNMNWTSDNTPIT